MDESSVETQELPPQAAESKAEKFRKWLKEKFAKNATAAPKPVSQAAVKKYPLPIAGGAIDIELPSSEIKEWRTDTTDRLKRAKPIGTNRMTTSDRAAAVGVIGDPKRSDIESRIGESLEDLSKRAVEKQRELKRNKASKNQAPVDTLKNAA